MHIGGLASKKTIFILPSGQKLLGPKQTFGSLYKEFKLDDKVYKFYLYQANNQEFIYKCLGMRKIEIGDQRLPVLLKVVEDM